MSMQDPIADLFSRLNNAQARQKTSVVVPSSKFKISLMTLLQNKGYIESFNVTDNDKPEIEIKLRYFEGAPVIKELKRISKPGLRQYAGKEEMPEIDFSKFGPVEIQPLSRIKKKTGINLHRSWLNLPIVTHHDEADITELEYFRKSLKDEAAKQGVRVTALAFLLRASAVAIRKHPNFNSSLTVDCENLVLKKYHMFYQKPL